ncbi:MAG: hypothetical protein G01um101429_641 [Parcubacteria group bacterium Gr01-1014_29]|nr:MAG: hypothetical protein G01um101429_641 [Parcubacteria group bacterium Gr01-1014_29]
MMKRRNGTKGFTLLEMIVAVGIFSMVAVLASGSAFLFHRLQRKAINAQNVHDNIRFALDTMAREIRTGDKFCHVSLPTGCVNVSAPSLNCSWASGGCTQFSFRESLADTPNIAYRLNTGAPGGGAIQKSTDGGVQWYYITDPERTISTLRFYASGITAFPDEEQERVTIVIEVKSAYLAKPGEESRLLLQTTVTKRKAL